MNSFSKKIVRAGIFCALYVVLSLVTYPVASGFIQVRIGEALSLLPLLFIESVPALFIGCAIINLITGCAIFDIVLGSLITLLSASITYMVGKLVKTTPLKIFLGGLAPVLLNAFLLPIIWYYCYGKMEYIYILQVAIILLGQAFSVYALGSPLFININKKLQKGIITK